MTWHFDPFSHVRRTSILPPEKKTAHGSIGPIQPSIFPSLRGSGAVHITGIDHGARLGFYSNDSFSIFSVRLVSSLHLFLARSLIRSASRLLPVIVSSTALSVVS